MLAQSCSLLTPGAFAAYPIAAVPYSNVDFEGNNRPYGLFALASAHKDALLVEFMSAWERVAPPRQPPRQRELHEMNNFALEAIAEFCHLLTALTGSWNFVHDRRMEMKVLRHL